MRFRLAILLCGLLAVATSVSHACSCAILGSACGAFHINDTLFIGKALSVRIIDIKTDGKFTYHHRVFRFEISETIAGPLHKAEIVEVETGMGGGDCGYGFQLGDSYLVDAFHGSQQADLMTNICTGTRTLSQATNLLREIRTVLAGGRLPDLSGTIWQGDTWQDAFSNPHTMVGIHVQLTPMNGNNYTAISDADGIYTFRSVPPGLYKVDFALPSSRVSADVANGGLTALEIPSSGGAGAACHRDVTALPVGKIEGQVVDSSGKGLGVLGDVSLRKPGQSKNIHASTFLRSPDGRFAISYVPAGTYQVVFHQFSPDREAWMAADDAHPDGTVTLQDGQQLEGIRIVVK